MIERNEWLTRAAAYFRKYAGSTDDQAERRALMCWIVCGGLDEQMTPEAAAEMDTYFATKRHS